MRKFFLKLIGLLLTSCLIILIVSQIYVRYNNSYKTQIVDVSIIKEKSKAKGIIYKDEIVLNYDGGNIKKNMQPNGAKVGMNSKIVQIYDSKEDALKYDRILELKEELKNLENIQNERQSKNLDFSSIEKQIYSNYYEFLDDLNRKNLNNLDYEKRKLIYSLNMRETIINKNTDFNTSISNIKKEIENIEKGMKMPKIIFSKNTGYFVGCTDGFENVCSTNHLEDLNFKNFSNFFNSYDSYRKHSDQNVKIITGHKILFKAIMKTKDLANRKINCDCKIKFKEIDQEVDANLKSVDLNFNEQYGLGVFEILNMNEKLASFRKGEAEVVFKEFEGFKLPKTAIRNNSNNETGVYVVKGSNMKFKKVFVLCEDEDFVICSTKPKNNSKPFEYLKNLDTVIVKGRNLYENKRI